MNQEIKKISSEELIEELVDRNERIRKNKKPP